MSLNAYAHSGRDAATRFATTLFVCLAAVSAGLASEKTIDVGAQHNTDAVVITEITVGNLSIQAGQPLTATQVQPVTPFQAGEDWLQQTVVHFLNRTNKTIAFFQIALVFPETAPNGVERSAVGHVITLGRIPDVAAYSNRTGQNVRQTNAPIAFAAGTTMTMALADYLAPIQAGLNLPLSNLTKCSIRRTIVYFDDGMRWDGEYYATPDTSHPGAFTKLEPRYFPGIPSWPPKVQ